MRRFIPSTLVFVLAACAVGRPLDLDDFKSACVMYDGGSGLASDSWSNGCSPGDQGRICWEFTDAVENAKDLHACLAGCSRIERESTMRFTVSGCNRAIDNGLTYCRRYCRGNFAP